MKKFLSLFILFCASAFSQTDSSTWKHNLVAGLTATQVSFNDWAGGGENALAYTTVIDGRSVQDLETTNWSNTYKLAYGQTRLGSKPLRKTDDKLEFESVLSYKVGMVINPYASFTLKTQFDVGYKYDDAANTKTVLSRFWAPAYLTQSVGIGYAPRQEIKTRLGAALREVRTRTGYIENNRTEGGIESVTDAQISFEQNILFTSKLELFAPFNNIDVVVMRSDNSFTAKVSSIISVTLNIQLINDANVSARTQIKETIALGITYALI
ncbi:MAG: DUF3078 domain-containing protein [Ignavibacteriales bacterium]|nr:DUF3078 domain-containing protein [Ignavibacteriales bacterium]